MHFSSADANRFSRENPMKMPLYFQGKRPARKNFTPGA
jgi:hypothetical protein